MTLFAPKPHMGNIVRMTQNNPKNIETCPGLPLQFRRPLATNRAPKTLILGMFRQFGIIGPNMGVAAPPQKFARQLLSRKQVSKKNQSDPLQKMLFILIL